ncbi:hypothetical protein [Sinomonas susongensis]|uniref:hypothetical protein n=1 Tax=Sinomonas susongensis TaxID=1324851 RepID=UPI0011093F63|nr:hypothetical protein [Sinomonas susongensis]
MLGRLYVRYFPILHRIQLVGLILLSIVAAIGLWAAPLPTDLKNLDPLAAKYVALGGVTAFGVLVPFVLTFTKVNAFSALKIIVYLLAGVSHGFSLSPYLATPVQTVASLAATVVCTLLASAQLVELHGSILSADPKSKF